MNPRWQAEQDVMPRLAGPLPRRLRPILAELISGVPDMTASRRLNISTRTYSRRVAELLDYLGVATRFQAGVEIVRRGWALAPPGAKPQRAGGGMAAHRRSL